VLQEGRNVRNSIPDWRFYRFGKLYIWVWKDILKNEADFGFDQGWELGAEGSVDGENGVGIYTYYGMMFIAWVSLGG